MMNIEEVKFDKPTKSDEDDLRILLKRCLKPIDQLDWINKLLNVHKFIAQFQHEYLEDILLDFATDRDLWDWILDKNEKPTELSGAEKELARIIQDDIRFLLADSKLFKI